MDYVLPKSTEIYPVYQCPNPDCQATFQVRVEETQFPGGALCGCGTKIRFKPILAYQVVYEYDDKNRSTPVVRLTKPAKRADKPSTRHVTVTEVAEAPKSQKIFGEVVDALQKLGYTKIRAREMASNARPEKFSSTESLLQAVIK